MCRFSRPVEAQRATRDLVDIERARGLLREDWSYYRSELRGLLPNTDVLVRV